MLTEFESADALGGRTNAHHGPRLMYPRSSSSRPLSADIRGRNRVRRNRHNRASRQTSAANGAAPRTRRATRRRPERQHSGRVPHGRRPVRRRARPATVNLLDCAPYTDAHAYLIGVRVRRCSRHNMLGIVHRSGDRLHDRRIVHRCRNRLDDRRRRIVHRRSVRVAQRSRMRVGQRRRMMVGQWNGGMTVGGRMAVGVGSGRVRR